MNKHEEIHDKLFKCSIAHVYIDCRVQAAQQVRKPVRICQEVFRLIHREYVENDEQN